MELRHIRYFLAVAEEQSFTRAAERLGIGQPPLSQQIRDLERDVGVTLFHRLPRGAELTEAGQAFYRQVQSLPSQVEVATREARYIARGETGSLKIGFTSAAALYPVVQSSIRNFRRTFPDVDLSLEEANTSTLTRWLEERILDVVFIRATAKHIEDFRVIKVDEEPMIAVLPADHRLSSRTDLALAELRDEPFILPPRHVGPTSYETVITACREAGFEPRPGQVAPQMLSVISLVSVGLGVSVVPAAMRRLQLNGCRYVEIRGGPRIQLSVACRRDNRSKVLANFLARVRDDS